jgi:hypothetical protein
MGYQYKVYTVPLLLQWVIPWKSNTMGQEPFSKHSRRLALMAETLRYGILHQHATYGVWAIWEAFRGRVGRATIADWARLFQYHGFIRLSYWENRPREINVPKAVRFIDEVEQWVKAEPTLVTGGSG